MELWAAGLATTAGVVAAGSATAAAVAVGGAAIGGAAIGLGANALSHSLSGGGGGGGAGGAGGLPTTPYAFTPISNVSYNPGQGASDLNSMFPSLAKYAANATAYQTKQREKIMPGSGALFSDASGVLNSELHGQVPQDVVDFTNRQVASRSGGNFNPFTGGGQTPTDFARSIGRLSTDFTQAGISAAPAWLQLANSFVTSTNDAGQLAIGLNETRYKYDALNTSINQFNSTGQGQQFATNYQVGANNAMFETNQANLAGAQGRADAGMGVNALQSLYSIYNASRPTLSSTGGFTSQSSYTSNGFPITRTYDPSGQPAWSAAYNGGAPVR